MTLDDAITEYLESDEMRRMLDMQAATLRLETKSIFMAGYQACLRHMLGELKQDLRSDECDGVAAPT